MARNFASLALTALLTVALIWGNCATCINMLPAAPSTSAAHDCCEPESKSAPDDAKPGDCALMSVDLAKATQPEHPQLVSAVVAISGPVVAVASAPIVHLAADVPPLGNTSPPALYLLNSVLLV